jgi:hypothetical protein
MVRPPALPVKAPFSNYRPSPSKPFTCHTSAKSREFPTSSDRATTNCGIVPSCANSFTHISFADPHPLNSVVSYRYRNRGGWVSWSTTVPYKVPYTLPSSVCGKSFICHSYENCRVYPLSSRIGTCQSSLRHSQLHFQNFRFRRILLHFSHCSPRKSALLY